jgi:hypothetical protein
MRFLLLAVFTIIAFGCRKEAEDDTRLKVTSETIWYDSQGNPGTCETQTNTCDYAIDPIKSKEFITTCVGEKKGRAQSCGCTIKCTSQWDFGEIKILTSENKQQLDSEKGQICTEAQQKSIKSLLNIAITDGSRRDCASLYLCQGIEHKCKQPQDLEFARKLRSMGRGPCLKNIVNGFCPTEFSDSLSCQDQTISKLSKYWMDYIESNQGNQKTCLQNVICNGRDNSCSANGLKIGKEIANSLKEPGCDYWQYHFCKL